MSEKKLILLTNDDGINAQGILVLREALSQIADCFIVAPAEERSACSHAITLHGSLRFEEVQTKGVALGYKVWGMPADCVKIALCKLLPKKPDLIVSGINNGANIGVSINYSGTVAAAREGAILNIPALALSVVHADHEILHYASILGAKISERMMQQTTPLFLNVNIPDIAPHEIQGFQVTNQADSYFDEWFVKADTNGSKDPAYILHGDMVVRKPDEMNDTNSLGKGYVTLTPLRLDLTDYNAIDKTNDLVRDILVNKTEALPQ